MGYWGGDIASSSLSNNNTVAGLPLFYVRLDKSLAYPSHLFDLRYRSASADRVQCDMPYPPLL